MSFINPDNKIENLLHTKLTDLNEKLTLICSDLFPKSQFRKVILIETLKFTFELVYETRTLEYENSMKESDLKNIDISVNVFAYHLRN